MLGCFLPFPKNLVGLEDLGAPSSFQEVFPPQTWSRELNPDSILVLGEEETGRGSWMRPDDPSGNARNRQKSVPQGQEEIPGNSRSSSKEEAMGRFLSHLCSTRKWHQNLGAAFQEVQSVHFSSSNAL